MWKAGFPYEESACATLYGAHRALCVYSVRHRGNRKRPGLVLGLDVGGRCDGIVYRVKPGAERKTRCYLKVREQSTMAYREAIRPVHLNDGSERTVRAICYLANRSHRQYAGGLNLERQAHIVRNGEGRSGHNMEYYFNTVRHLESLGIIDKPFLRLASLLGDPWARMMVRPINRKMRYGRIS
jgi:cation transport protein ChaC